MNLFGFPVSSQFAEKIGLDKKIEELKKDLTWTPLPSSSEVWEQGKKNGDKMKEEIKRKKEIETLPTEGMIRPGNLDIDNRIKVQNKDNSFSTIESMSFNEEGIEILIPTIDHKGQRMSEKEAIDFYHKTGEHLGMFASGEFADNYAKALSKRQGEFYKTDGN